MLSIDIKDHSVQNVSKGLTGTELLEHLDCDKKDSYVGLLHNGVLYDLMTPLLQDGTIHFIERDHPEALHLLQHTCAHVLGEAVQSLWPETKLAIGPVIQDGFYYDFDRPTPFTPQELEQIEHKMHELIERNQRVKRSVLTLEEAKKFFSNSKEPYKEELLESFPEGTTITFYAQGTWQDLCKGPHLPSIGLCGHAFKLLSVAGAYWRGDSNNKMLTRIYGTVWPTQEDLESYLFRKEEALRRDHRRLGRDLDLFHFEETGPGVIFWHPKGWTIVQELIAFMRRQLQGTYQEISTPQLLDRALWERSGHWEWYQEHMFVTETEDLRCFCIKPMNCPGHVMTFNHATTSYKQLPVRLSEFGNVSRYEPSGALHGLMRVRAFTQDDAHIFCTEEQLEEECLKIHSLIRTVYEAFGFKDLTIKFSTRPAKRVGDDALWNHAERTMEALLERIKQDDPEHIKTLVNHGEGAFYGPKLEYVLKDSLGREWQCGTTQIDFNLPVRFKAYYTDSYGERKHPVMIHRAICGSIERFIGILIEHYAGSFPAWIAPIQVAIATITQDGDRYAEHVAEQCIAHGLRVVTDLKNEKLAHKIREHVLQKIPFVWVIGKKEVETQTIAIRRFGQQYSKTMALSEALAYVKSEALAPDLQP